jgi:hypothetical protein
MMPEPVRREMRFVTRCGCTRDVLLSSANFPREFTVPLAPTWDHAFAQFEDSAMMELFSDEPSRRVFVLANFQRDGMVLRGIYFEKGRHDGR